MVGLKHARDSPAVQVTYVSFAVSVGNVLREKDNETIWKDTWRAGVYVKKTQVPQAFTQPLIHVPSYPFSNVLWAQR